MCFCLHSSETMKSLITSYLSQHADQGSLQDSSHRTHSPGRSASAAAPPVVLVEQDGGMPARSVLAASIDLSAAIDRRAGLLSAAPAPAQKSVMDAATASVIYNEHFSGLQVTIPCYAATSTSSSQ